MPYVELVDLLGELVLLDGFSARNRKRETPLKVLHLVHGAEEQTLREERDEEIRYTNTLQCIRYMHQHSLSIGLGL